MRWVPFKKEITRSYRIEGDPSGKSRRLLRWRPYRWLADAFGHDQAVVVDVGEAAANAGYRVGLRQGDDVALVGEEVLHETQFMVIIGPQPWLLFLIDQNDACIAAEQVSGREDKAALEYANIWIV